MRARRAGAWLAVAAALASGCGGGAGDGPGGGGGTGSLELVLEGPGRGVVRAREGGFTCEAGTCSAATAGALTLEAVPAAGATFTGWAGDCDGPGTCAVAAGGVRRVRARFGLEGWRSGTAGGAGADRALALALGPDGTLTVALALEQAGSAGAGAAAPAGLSLAQYAPDGAVRWVRALPAEVSGVGGLAAEPDGRVVLAATFSGAVDLGSGPVASVGGTDVLLARLGADGRAVWARAHGGTGADAARALARAPDGDLLLAGEAGTGGIDLGTGLVGSTSRGFWARLSPTTGGARVAEGLEGVAALAGDARGRTLLTGHADGVSGGFFLRCVAGDGTVAWAVGPGSGSYGYSGGVGLVVDAEGAVSVAGNFAGQLRDVAGPSAGVGDAFVAHYGADGQRVWGRALGGAGDDFASGLALAPDGALVLAGRTRSGALDLGTGPLVDGPGLGQQALLAWLAPADGTVTRAVALGGSGEESADLLGAWAGGLGVAGTFEGSVHLGDAMRQTAGGQDVYVLSLP